MDQHVLSIRFKIINEVFGIQKPEESSAAVKLLRCHEKNLSKIGELSCPSDLELWKRVLPPDFSVRRERFNLPSQIRQIDIVKEVIELPNKYLNIFLNRSAILEELFHSYKSIDLEVRLTPSKTFAFGQKEDIDVCLTQVRKQQAVQFASRLVNQHTKDLSLLNVGPVVDKDSKKKSKCSFLEVYKKFHQVADLASKERNQNYHSDRQRIVQVHVLACAELQFQLLAPNLNQPAILDESAYSNATFVLYNHSRIVQLLHQAFKAIPDSQLKCNIDFSLLQEEEEWELAFLYLLDYSSIRKYSMSLTSKGEVKSGRLIRFLIALCHCFSRYYNRVHIITTAEHLWALQCARLELLKLIQRVIEDALTLLDIPLLGIM